MTAHSFVSWPVGTALNKLVRAVMEITLHIGAHRTATTTYQNYLCRNQNALLQRGIAIWTPRDTRSGLFRGVLPGVGQKPDFARATGRIGLQLRALEKRGIRKLLVSDENMLGTIYANLKSRTLYGDAGQRMAHFVQAFDGRLDRVVLSLRGQDKYWTSAAGYIVARGRPVPKPDTLASIARSKRSWRDVIADVSCAAGDAELRLTAFDRFAGQPDAHFKVMTGVSGPKDYARDHLNATPRRPALRSLLAERGADPDLVPTGEGRWTPFSPDQTAALAADWHKDHDWLRGHAGAIATYIDDPSRLEAGPTLSAVDLKRGQETDDRQNSRMAQAR